MFMKYVVKVSNLLANAVIQFNLIKLDTPCFHCHDFYFRLYTPIVC